MVCLCLFFSVGKPIHVIYSAWKRKGPYVSETSEAGKVAVNAASAAAAENIILIGMPGAGKSTLGVVLAKILKYDFLDADLVIQGKHGKTLQALIDERGPLGFLEAENQDLQEINAQRTVIATGGSAVYSDQAMEHLRKTGVVVYLRISYDQLVGRLGDLRERGVVMKDGMGMSLADLYAERLPLYERWAQVTVDVEGMSITDAAQKTAQVVREWLDR